MRERLLLMPVPGQHLCVRQLPAEYIQSAPYRDVHTPIPSTLHPFQVILKASGKIRWSTGVHATYRPTGAHPVPLLILTSWDML